MVSHLLGDAGSPYLIGVVSSSHRYYHMEVIGGPPPQFITTDTHIMLPMYRVVHDPGAGSVIAYMKSNPCITIHVCPYPQISDRISRGKPQSTLLTFRSLEYALMVCAFVGALGGGFFLATALFIQKDRKKAEMVSEGACCVQCPRALRLQAAIGADNAANSYGQCRAAIFLQVGLIYMLQFSDGDIQYMGCMDPT